MSDGNGALPDGWECGTLGTIAHIRTGKLDANAADEDGAYPFFTCAHDISRINEFAFDTEAVLLAGNGGFNVKWYQGRFNAYQRTYVIEPEGVSGRFLYHLIRYEIPEITEKNRGSTIKYLRLGDIANCNIELPPLAEQVRIVSKIESLQERSSCARVALSEVGPLLDQFRQSVLRAAFSGRLTADWRAAHRDVEPATELLSRIRTERRHRWEQSELAKYEAKGKKPPKNWKDKYKEPEPVRPDEVAELATIPDEWCWSRFADFCTVQGGFAFKSKDYSESGIPLIRIGDLDDGAVRIDDSTARLPSEFVNQQPQFRLNSGDVLIAMSGATTGKMAVFESDEVALLNQRVGRFLPHAPNLIHSPYLRGLVESIVEDIRNRAYGGAQPNISPTEIASTPVAFPPLEEQVRIAELLSDSRDAASRVESEVAESESSLVQLDQSILAKAFRGELVPQDPRDEPASELLARIRTTREAEAATKKTTKRKRKSK